MTEEQVITYRDEHEGIVLREQLGVETPKIGDHVGTLNVEVRPARWRDRQLEEVVEALNAARERIAELERLLLGTG